MHLTVQKSDVPMEELMNSLLKDVRVKLERMRRCDIVRSTARCTSDTRICISDTKSNSFRKLRQEIIERKMKRRRTIFRSETAAPAPTDLPPNEAVKYFRRKRPCPKSKKVYTKNVKILGSLSKLPIEKVMDDEFEEKMQLNLDNYIESRETANNCYNQISKNIIDLTEDADDYQEVNSVSIRQKIIFELSDDDTVDVHAYEKMLTESNNRAKTNETISNQDNSLLDDINDDEIYIESNISNVCDETVIMLSDSANIRGNEINPDNMDIGDSSILSSITLEENINNHKTETYPRHTEDTDNVLIELNIGEENTMSFYEGEYISEKQFVNKTEIIESKPESDMKKEDYKYISKNDFDKQSEMTNSNLENKIIKDDNSIETNKEIEITETTISKQVCKNKKKNSLLDYIDHDENYNTKDLYIGCDKIVDLDPEIRDREEEKSPPISEYIEMLASECNPDVMNKALDSNIIRSIDLNTNIPKGDSRSNNTKELEKVNPNKKKKKRKSKYRKRIVFAEDSEIITKIKKKKVQPKKYKTSSKKNKRRNYNNSNDENSEHIDLIYENINPVTIDPILNIIIETDKSIRYEYLDNNKTLSNSNVEQVFSQHSSVIKSSQHNQVEANLNKDKQKNLNNNETNLCEHAESNRQKIFVKPLKSLQYDAYNKTNNNRNCIEQFMHLSNGDVDQLGSETSSKAEQNINTNNHMSTTCSDLQDQLVSSVMQRYPKILTNIPSQAIENINVNPPSYTERILNMHRNTTIPDINKTNRPIHHQIMSNNSDVRQTIPITSVQNETNVSVYNVGNVDKYPKNSLNEYGDTHHFNSTENPIHAQQMPSYNNHFPNTQMHIMQSAPSAYVQNQATISPSNMGNLPRRPSTDHISNLYHNTSLASNVNQAPNKETDYQRMPIHNNSYMHTGQVGPSAYMQNQGTIGPSHMGNIPRRPSTNHISNLYHNTSFASNVNQAPNKATDYQRMPVHNNSYVHTGQVGPSAYMQNLATSGPSNMGTIPKRPSSNHISNLYNNTSLASNVNQAPNKETDYQRMPVHNNSYMHTGQVGPAAYMQNQANIIPSNMSNEALMPDVEPFSNYPVTNPGITNMNPRQKVSGSYVQNLEKNNPSDSDTLESILAKLYKQFRVNYTQLNKGTNPAGIISNDIITTQYMNDRVTVPTPDMINQQNIPPRGNGSVALIPHRVQDLPRETNTINQAPKKRVYKRRAVKNIPNPSTDHVECDQLNVASMVNNKSGPRNIQTFSHQIYNQPPQVPNEQQPPNVQTQYRTFAQNQGQQVPFQNLAMSQQLQNLYSMANPVTLSVQQVQDNVMNTLMGNNTNPSRGPSIPYQERDFPHSELEQLLRSSPHSIQPPGTLSAPSPTTSTAQPSRSVSRDSGFLSPANQNMESPPPFEPSIVKVRSLKRKPNGKDPGNIGNCRNCNKITNLVCTACYSVYYCSISCKSIDWYNYHQYECSGNKEK